MNTLVLSRPAHENARLTAWGRRAVVRRVAAGEPVAAVARAVGVSRQTVYKWCRRARTDATCQDRSARPRRSPHRLPRHRRRQIAKARARRWSSLRIARHYQLPVSTVVTHARRLGLARLPRLAPPAPVVRYERATPGELVHLDVLLAEWAYARPYGHSRARQAALAPYLTTYNFHRPHTALGFCPPATRLPAAL